jgi:type II secretory pathway pseudopilin PulG
MNIFNRNRLNHRKRARNCKEGGFTLLEALLTIGLAAVILAIYSALLMGVFFLSRTEFGIQATSFVQEGLDALRTLEYEDLLTRTDGNLLGLAFTRGEWVVTEDSGNNILRLTAIADDIGGETGLAVLPGNYRTDFTLTSKVRARTLSPTGWDAGVAVRYRDMENHYRFRFSAGGIAFDKVEDGAVTTLWSQSATYDKDTWYELKVVASGDQFTLIRDSITLTTLNDSTFTIGDLAIGSFDSALVDTDDVSVIETATTTWDFESETTGEMPADWRRISAYDLPEGTITLSIEDYLGQADMKKCTVDVTWLETALTKTATGTVVITSP